ncbi:heparanase-like protein 2 [Phalaenopsis equestris]|uniref:heparanase-like protein 2 n=1 Tax=Phalaenopsis equestris TaxID=78828 RepID=UPI0009E4912A|nr:heparanase-like protein 2 [Phalaenopsis equestris]
MREMSCRYTLLFYILLIISNIPHGLQKKVTVSIQSVTTIAKTDYNFICATLDWWPPEKCNYNMCPWGNSSILNLDLNNTILNNAIKAFSSLRIRLGGSLQDQVTYKVGKNSPPCNRFIKLKKPEEGLFGFSTGCLDIPRWDELNVILSRAGAVLTFGLNALYGRRKTTSNGLYNGDWNSQNARELINYTVSKNYMIDSWEFGNELSGSGIGARVEADQYGKDLISLKALIDELYQKSSSKPKILAPGGFYDQAWFNKMLQTSGPDVVNGVTHHIYNLGGGDDKGIIQKILDPYYLYYIVQTFKNVALTIKNFGPWSSSWVGEAGGAYNSGAKDVSNTFVNSFWYLDQLGIASVFGSKVYCRQALIGGNYALLNTTTFEPNPDYYSALLWSKLMGPEVLQTTHNGSPYLRAYTHCSKNKAGVTLLLINLSNSTTFKISVENDMNLYPPQQRKLSASAMVEKGEREEYRLVPKDGKLQSRVVLLNGQQLQLTGSRDIPEINPFVPGHRSRAKVQISPLTIVFVRFKDFRAPACPIKN